jgi:hypothetical protein
MIIGLVVRSKHAYFFPGMMTGSNLGLTRVTAEFE